jgi:hypothetical protein
MVNIPPLVFFYWAAKIGGEIQMKKLSQKEFGIWDLEFEICQYVYRDS